MIVQLNTDKTIKGDEKQHAYYADWITKELERYESHITRIEAHITDQNGKKDGIDDIRCLLEARLEGRQPIAVSHQADTMKLAVSGAIHNLKAALEKIIKRLQNH